MALKSGISKEFRKEFIMDEDALRRFHGILEKASKEHPEPLEIVFHIEREDDRYYEVKDVDDLLSDPNVPNKRVESLFIELRPSQRPPVVDGSSRTGWIINEWVVQIIYSARNFSDIFNIFDPYFRDRVFLRIASADKNWALLLSDELDTQIKRTFKSKSVSRLALWMLVVPFLILLVKFRTYYNQIDFATNNVWHFVAFVILILTFLIVATAFIATIDSKPTWFRRVFGPESVFLWGDEAKSYGEREAARQNFFWTIVVGFIISLISSVVLALMLDV